MPCSRFIPFLLTKVIRSIGTSARIWELEQHRTRGLPPRNNVHSACCHHSAAGGWGERQGSQRNLLCSTFNGPSQLSSKQQHPKPRAAVRLCASLGQPAASGPLKETQWRCLSIQKVVLMCWKNSESWQSVYGGGGRGADALAQVVWWK